MNEPIMILITGKQGSGKTTLAAKLEKYMNGPGAKHRMAARDKFAGTLYECTRAVLHVLNETGIPVPREQEKSLLQLLGTDWGRQQLGKDVWVRALVGKIARYKLLVPFVLIDDCRFENELNAFPAGHTYKIRCLASRDTRRGRCDGWRDNEFHPSETGLDNVPNEAFDYLAVTDKQMPGYQDPVSLGCAILLDLDRRFQKGVYRGQERTAEVTTDPS